MQQKLAELALEPMPLKPAEFDALVENDQTRKASRVRGSSRTETANLRYLFLETAQQDTGE
jgi:hypothetical protein